MRVFKSRYTPGLSHGDGSWIGWDKGETGVICDGRDKGRRFVVTSEGMSHAAAPAGELIREGYFVDDPLQTPYAKMERQLWFAEDSEAERAAGMVALGLK